MPDAARDHHHPVRARQFRVFCGLSRHLSLLGYGVGSNYVVAGLPLSGKGFVPRARVSPGVIFAMETTAPCSILGTQSSNRRLPCACENGAERRAILAIRKWTFSPKPMARPCASACALTPIDALVDALTDVVPEDADWPADCGTCHRAGSGYQRALRSPRALTRHRA